MEAYGGDDKSETAKFILLMDRFFDCLNVRALDEGDMKRKPDLAPFRSLNDPRFRVGYIVHSHVFLQWLLIIIKFEVSLNICISESLNAIIEAQDKIYH